MAATTVGVIYSGTTGRIRSVVIPDFDSQLINRALGKGEAIQIVSSATYSSLSLDGLQSFLEGITGLSPTSDRYVSIDASGNVIDIHIADPVGCADLSPYAGCSLTAHATANRTDILWNNKLLPNTPMSRSSNNLGLQSVLGRTRN
jgi:hypothetical protein